MPEVVSRLIELCVFRFVHDRAEYLLLKRSRSDGEYPGIWQIVTGTIKKDETAIQTTLREMHEETSLHPVRLWAVPFSSTFYDHAQETMNIIPFFAAQTQPTDEPVLSGEHEMFEWMPYDKACRHVVWPSQRKGLEVVDSYIVGGAHAGLVTLVPLPC